MAPQERFELPTPGSQELCSGLKLSHHLLGSKTNLEVHHIFPKALLYGNDYSRRQVNAIANFTFLTADCNKRLSSTPPDTYLPRVRRDHPDALPSHWIPDDQQLWETDAYLDFLEDRRQRLADAANSILDSLLAGRSGPEIVRSAAAASNEDAGPVDELSDWCAQLGLSRPEIAEPIIDETTGEPLVYPDVHWPEGMQQGKSEKVALILEPDVESEERLGELGYRFFTSIVSLQHYVETLLNIDMDGDGIIGPVEEAESLASVTELRRPEP